MLDKLEQYHQKLLTACEKTFSASAFNYTKFDKIPDEATITYDVSNRFTPLSESQGNKSKQFLQNLKELLISKENFRLFSSKPIIPFQWLVNHYFSEGLYDLCPKEFKKTYESILHIGGLPVALQSVPKQHKKIIIDLLSYDHSFQNYDSKTLRSILENSFLHLGEISKEMSLTSKEEKKLFQSIKNLLSQANRALNYTKSNLLYNDFNIQHEQMYDEHIFNSLRQIIPANQIKDFLPYFPNFHQKKNENTEINLFADSTRSIIQINLELDKFFNRYDNIYTLGQLSFFNKDIIDAIIMHKDKSLSFLNQIYICEYSIEEHVVNFKLESINKDEIDASQFKNLLSYLFDYVNQNVDELLKQKLENLEVYQNSYDKLINSFLLENSLRKSSKKTDKRKL